ncbi:MAG: L-threonylcarbamoyladenylate synthase [Bacteroidota bacterium]|nr:L-threonylcarbamoyladenylate synthase [Bacteroidota bacterium]
MNDFSNDIKSSIKVLLRGGIILYPTDTIWGIGCDATKGVAVKKIYQLKKRAEKKSLIILVADENEISNYVATPSQKILDFISIQQHPTTAIFKNAIHLPKEIINEDGSVAIRIVKDDFCLAILHQLKGPLVSTSANISGEASPQNFQQVSTAIKNGVDFIVQHRRNEIINFRQSSIIKLNSLDEIEKIR